jgi:hypothetical protein
LSSSPTTTTVNNERPSRQSSKFIWIKTCFKPFFVI